MSISSPSDGSAVTGITTVSIDYDAGTYNDPTYGLTQDTVDFLAIYIDGTEVYNDTTQTKTSGTLDYSWDTTSYSDGSHLFEVKMKAVHDSDILTDSATYIVDNNPPSSCTITAPADGSWVGGTVGITVSASDAGTGVKYVEFYIDNTLKYNDTASPWAYNWDSTTASDGSHSIYAFAYDGFNRGTQSSTITVYVDNTPPSVSITNPADGATVSGTVYLKASASDGGSGMDKVEYYNDSIDSNHFIGSSTDGTNNYQVSWDTTTTSDGSHTIYAVAYDNVGNTNTVSITVTVDNSPPTVSITSPTSGSWVHGTTTITVDASDPQSGITEVDFYVDNNLVYQDTASPWEYAWDTTQVGDGSHTVDVVAINGLGDTSQDTATYNVDNTPPSVSVSSPTDNSWVSGTITISGSSSDSGSGVAQMTIEISGVGQVASASSTSISYNWDTTSVADGTYTIWVNATDVAGNLNSTSIIVYVDNTPPNAFDLSKPANNTVMNTKTITFYWGATTDTGSGLDHYVLYIYNSTWSDTYTTTTNSTTITLSVNDGTYSWYVVAYDAVGNARQSTSTYSFTIDTTAAQFTVSVSADYFSPNGDGYNETTTISAQTTDGSSVYWYVEIYNSSNSLVRTYKPSASATASFTWTWGGDDNSGAILPTDTYTVRVWADDGVGNNASQDVITHIDLTPPAIFHLIYVDGKTNNTFINDSSPTFTWGQSDDSESGFWKYVLYISSSKPTDYATADYVYNIVGKTNTAYTIPDTLADGTWYWWVVAYDYVYNKRLVSENYWVFTVDTSIPQINTPTVEPYWFSPNGDNFHDILYINASSNEEVNWDVQIYLASNNSEAYNYGISYGYTLAYTYAGSLKYGDGQYYVLIRITDDAGNSNTTTLYFVQDTTPMSAPSIIQPTDGAYIGTSTVQFEWSNAPADNTTNAWWKDILEIYNESGSLIWNPTFTVRGSTDMTTSISLTDGVYHYHILRYDMAGNVVDTGYIYFTVDTTPPTKPVLVSPADNTLTNAYFVNFTWNASDDATPLTYTLRLYYASTGQLYQTYTTTNTWYEVDFSAISTQASFKWNVSVEDSAGNVNVSAETWTVSIDHDIPEFTYTISYHYISPNGDSRHDTITVNTTATSNGGEALKWEFIVESPPADGQLPVVYYNFTTSGYYSTYSWTWDGTDNNGATLPDGNYTIEIRAYDMAGNMNISDSWVIVDNTQPPAPAINAPADYSYLNNATVNITWAWSGNLSDVYKATLYIYNSSGQYGTLTIDTSTTYFQTSYPDGRYYAYIVVEDLAGNQNVSNQVHFTVDTTPPSTFDLNSPNGVYYNNGTAINLTWNPSSDVNFNNYSVHVYYGGAWHVFYTTNTYYVLDFPAGEYNITWYVVASDLAGNVRRSTSTYEFYVDTVAPRDVYNIAPAGVINYTNNITFRWNTANDTYFAYYQFVILENGTVYYIENTTATQITLTLPDGDYYWYVVGIDRAGNRNASASWHLYVDTTPPVPFDLVSPNGTYYANGSAINLTWNASADEFFSNYLVVVYYNGTYHNFTTTNTWYVVNLPDGEYEVKWWVYAVDNANNRRHSNQTFTIYVDTVAPRNLSPNAPNGLWNSSATVNFTWSAVNDAYFSHYHFVLLQNGTVIYEVNTTNTWIELTLGDGNYSWYVEAIDMAGNVATTSATAFFVDANAPVATGHTPKQYYNSTVPIWINASDGNGTGVQYIYVYYSWNGGAWILYNKYYGNTTYVELTFSNAGFYQIAIVAEDYAGHKEAISPDLSFTIDKAAPSGSIVIDNGATYTSNGTVLVNLSYSDDYGVQYYRYRIDGGNWSDWIMINATASGSRGFWLTLPFVEGSHTVEVQFMDVANNTSPIYSDDITADLYAPEFVDGNITPYYSGDGNATVWVNATDNISGVAWIYYSFDGVNWTKIAYTDNFAITSTVEGVIYIYIIFEDNVGHNSTVITLNYTVDLSAPYGSLHLNATYGSLNITIYLNASDNITWVEYFRYRVDGGAWSDWIPYSPTYVIDVGTAGTHTVEVQYMDKVGHTSPTYSATTVVSIVPPTVDFTVENATANNTVGWENITLNINASSDAGLKQMRIVIENATGAVIYDSGWIAYNETYLVRITATGYYNITVYVRDNADNEANTTHTIYVDLDAPVISGVSVEHYISFTNTTTITVSATDFSGVARYGYAINGTFVAWFTDSTFSIVLPTMEGNYTITIYVEDVYGHVATADTWVYEIQHKPTGSVSVDTHLTNNDTFTVHFSASDPVFSIVGMYVKIDDGDWVYYNFTAEMSISVIVDGNHTIYVKFVNDKGIESDVYSTWIVVDTAPPTTEIISHLPAYTNATAITFTVQGTDTLSGFAYYKVYIRYNGGAWAFVGAYLPNQTTVSIALQQEGTYEIAIVGYDNAGNHEEITAKATIVVDWTAPTLNVNAQNTTLTDTFNYTLSWSAQDNDGIAYYIILIYRDTLTRAELWKTINTTATSINLTFEDNYTYTIVIRAYDLAGNFVEKSLAITEDYNYAPAITNVDVPENITAGQEATFYAEAGDVKGDELNYTWMIGNDTVGYGQYLKYTFKKAGNYTITLIVSDGVHMVVRNWTVQVAPAPTGSNGSERNMRTPDIFMDLIMPILLFVGLLLAIILVILMMMKKKKGAEEKEESLSQEEFDILKTIQEYLKKHNGEKMETVIKAVATKINERMNDADERIEENDVLMVLDYGVSKGIFTKETDADGNIRIFLASPNMIVEERSDGGES